MIATYRLQLTPSFGFAEAAALTPYFAELGISHLYLSPITEARPGSTHGYDVVDHNRIRKELGGEEEFERLRTRCVEAGLGIVIDFVPNHAGIGPTNEAWQDVLAYGPASRFADTFDLDLGRDRKVLLPFLGRYYGDVLDAGELTIVFENDRLFAAYADHRYALRPESYRTILERIAQPPDARKLLGEYGLLTREDRARAEELRARFAQHAAPVRAGLAELDRDAVHRILEEQRWRLAYWKTAGAEINYRRFFDINDLVGLRMESPPVFARTHKLLAELLSRPGVDGVRIDHVDGLYDPRGYLVQLRELGARHVWVEKILAPREFLPASWPVEGTTGYEVMNDIVRVLVPAQAEAPLTRAWQRTSGTRASWEDLVHAGKRLVMRTSLSGQLGRLSSELHRMSEADYHTRDFTWLDLSDALAEVIAALDRYRTYLPNERSEDEQAIHDAVALARHRNPATDPSVFDFVTQAILGPLREDLEPLRRRWVGRWQQYTAPVAAKGVEDTAIYRDHRLLALSEVGGEPDRFALDPTAFHSRARFRAACHPRALTATATHDHKRGEDVRMRLVLLAELHRSFGLLTRRLNELGARHLSPLGPSASDCYLLHQTMLALWGSEALQERLITYVHKAAREAKRHTSWVHPDEAYESTLVRYVQGMLDDGDVAAAVGPFAAKLARLGFVHSVTQTVLKHCLPGVPDLYQGTELLDLSLVDPDNRRPVDFAHRARLLRQMRRSLRTPDLDALRRLLEAHDERLKLYVHARLLRLRRAHPDLLSGGEHRGLRSERHTLAFLRRDDQATIAVVVPRLLTGRSKKQVARVRGIPRGRYRDALTDVTLDVEGELPLAELPLPWSVLVAE